jgi:hypothetical protein
MRDEHRTVFNRMLLSIALLLGSLAITFSSAANAQTGTGGWSIPVKLFQAEGGISEPALAADQTGILHAFWTHQAEALPPAIYYARWNGNEWTQPVDIAATDNVQGPSAVADQFGRLHLIWQGPGNMLSYSSARVEDATNATGWSSPASLAPSNPHAHIVADQQGNLHIVYPGTRDTGIYHTVSTDGGATWRAPELVSVPANNSATTDFARVAVAPGGSLHVVWTESRLPVGVPYLGIYYARSSDGGRTWTLPQPMGTSSASIEANIIAVSDDEIYVAWNGSVETSGRYERWSGDGGDSWSEPNTLASPKLHGGSTNPPGLAMDSAGTVHVVVNTQPGGIVGADATMYVHGRKDEWSPPDDVSQQVPDYAGLTNEASAIATTAGNRISIVLVDNAGARLWHTWKTAAAPGVGASAFLPDRLGSSAASRDKPKALVLSSSTEVTAAPAPTNSSFKPSASDLANRVSTSPETALLVGILPALVVVGGVVLLKLTRRRLG